MQAQESNPAWNRPGTAPLRNEVAARMEQVLYEVKRVVVGQDAFLERVLVAMLPEVICWSRGCPASPKRSP